MEKQEFQEQEKIEACPLCGEPSVGGKEHQKCMDIESMIADISPGMPLLWDWCGLTWGIGGGWFKKDTYLGDTLSVDLNNLFLYAVPKAVGKIMAEQECSSDVAYAILFKKWLQKLELDIPNHVGTLFWAIWEVIYGS